jgi:5-methylcytosine-specific restriction endonuclease McrA
MAKTKTPKQKAAHAAYMRQYMADRPKKRKRASKSRMARAKAELDANPKAVRAKRAAHTASYRARHPDRVKADLKSWRARNGAAFRMYARNRRALKAKSNGVHTEDDIAARFKAQRGRCAYCRKSLNRGYHVDHIIALSKGGSN